MFQSLFYWITYSYNSNEFRRRGKILVSILILLDYLFLLVVNSSPPLLSWAFQSLFYWITYSYKPTWSISLRRRLFQSLFYWITYSYGWSKQSTTSLKKLFQSLFYWITYSYYHTNPLKISYGAGFNPYFIGLPILIS